MRRSSFGLIFIAVVLMAIQVFSINASPLVENGIAQTVNCPGAVPPRLVPGQQARVTPGLPNIFRSLPPNQVGSTIIGEIPAGWLFNVLADVSPVCVNGRLWWHVLLIGEYGWTPEAEVGGLYWTEPVSVTPPTPQPVGCLPTHLFTSSPQGIVTPGLPNVIRNQPYRGAGSQIVGYIPAGGVFNIYQQGYQPTCSDGILWLYVDYNGRIGWTPESGSGTYWTAPYGTVYCNGGAPSRLQVGGRARVTPGTPNSLRAAPSTNSQRLGYIYAGEVFTVLEGATCSSGIPYWRVQTAAGVIGWTGEGQYGTYWVEPLNG